MRCSLAIVVLAAAGCTSHTPGPSGLDLWLSPIHGETALVLSPTQPPFY